MASNRSHVEVSGLRELRRDLRQLAGDTADLKDANAAAAAIVATAAAARAPKRTGKLASTVRGNRAVSRATVSVGGGAVPYAGPIHWGWPARGITGQPFASDAAVETEPLWVAAYEQGVQRAVDKVGGYSISL